MTISFNSSPSTPLTKPSIRVFISDSHPINLWGLVKLINSSSRMYVVGTARTRWEVMNHDAAVKADVLLLDLDLAGEDTSDSLERLRERCPGRVLVFTATDDMQAHQRAV